MNRNIPSLYSLSQNALYNIVSSSDLERYNYPSQLVERYEDFARERAATDTQKTARANAIGKAKIINILNRVERRRREVGIPPNTGQNLIRNYYLTSEDGTRITRELNRLQIQDFMNQSFWWGLVLRGIRTSITTPPVPFTVEEAGRRSENRNVLLNIIRKFINLEPYVERGVIHRRDLGLSIIRERRDTYLQTAAVAALAGDRLLAMAAADMLWLQGFGKLGMIQYGPEMREETMFGRRR